MGQARRGITVALVAALGTTTWGCSALGGGPSPQPAAEKLAASLSQKSLEGVTTVGAPRNQAQQQVDDALAGLGDVEPTVTLGQVDDTRGGAVATLRWRWDVDGNPWRYSTRARLVEQGDAFAVRWAPSVLQPQLKAGQVLAVATAAPQRGDVLGAGGVHLVTDRPVVRIGIDKTQVKTRDLASSTRSLARLVDVDAAAFAKTVEAAGDSAFVEAITYRKADLQPGLRRQLVGIPGAVAIDDEIPLAPSKEFAAPVLGTVGQATAEVIKQSDGAVSAGDVVGLSGLQLRYDEQLRGKPGVEVVVQDAKSGDQVGQPVFSKPPVDGKPLRTTLDEKLQALADRLLQGVRPASGLVAIKPSTGDIVAAASGPGGDGYTTATFGQYAPGSTFKSVSSLALLRSGLMPSSPVPCTTSVTVDGKRFENYDDYPASALGRIPLRDAVANSCNTAIIASRTRLQDADLASAAAALGLGVDHDLGFPAYFGQVPPAESETEAAADMIGQGKVLASPLAMATVIASAQQGRTVLPRLLPDYRPPKGTPEPDHGLEPAEARQLRTMLRAVVTGGSGSILADVPGPPVIAKTGTAEFGEASPPKTHAWMIAAQGDLAVCVFVDVGSSGSGTAGPILESFLRGARGR